MNPIRFPTTRRHITALAGSALLGLALAPVAAQAQAPAWPTEPVRLVLSAPPGGTADIVARLLADGLQKEWGQPVVVESKPDGAGTFGVNELLMVKAGEVKVLEVSGAKCNPALPEVPTLAEQGYPSLDDTATLVLWSRPDVPADVQARIRSSALKALAQPAVTARLLEFGLDQGSGSTQRALGVNPQDLGS